MDYKSFLAKKAHSNLNSGFTPVYIPDFLFDFQKALVDWAINKGRAAIFADCGLGKTPMQLTFAQNVIEKTNKPFLLAAPLAVSYQIIQEGAKFGIDCKRTIDGTVHPGVVNITNYERLHYYNPDDFGGVGCDESSILKNFGGARRKEITKLLCKVQYRLLATATASPNDYVELGTSSEALGYLGHIDMLGVFFKSLDQNRIHVSTRYGKFWDKHKFTFKAHSEDAFWRWVCSWGRVLRKPSDLGFNDANFILPELTEREHIINTGGIQDGLLTRRAEGLTEERAERKNTLTERCLKVAELVDHDKPALVWCHLNVEGDELEKVIPGAVQVQGSDSDDEKERKLLGFANGEYRVLVTKPKIGAFGLNFQHCAHMVFFPSHSFEQYYQGVRRCWRFGQKNPVIVDVVASEGEANVMKNLKRKTKAADMMFENMLKHMRDELNMSSMPIADIKNINLPSWLNRG